MVAYGAWPFELVVSPGVLWPLSASLPDDAPHVFEQEAAAAPAPKKQATGPSKDAIGLDD